MKKNKVISRLSLGEYGVNPSSTWLEARLLSKGFSVLLWDEIYATRPRRVGVTSKRYSWKTFAELLMKLKEGFVDSDAHEHIKVQSESGLRADCLRIAWAYNGGDDAWVLPLLLAQSESSIDFLESQFNLFPDGRLSRIAREIFEALDGYDGGKDVIDLLNDYGFKHEKSSVNKLVELLEIKASEKEEKEQKKRLDSINSFKTEIDEIVKNFSDEKQRVGAGIGGSKPSERQRVRRWLEEYVVKNGSVPEGKHDVSVPFLGGRLNVGIIDFSAKNQSE